MVYEIVTLFYAHINNRPALGCKPISKVAEYLFHSTNLSQHLLLMQA
jgi:hypothetical protein